MTSYNLIVGTFNTPELYTLTFTPSSTSQTASKPPSKAKLEISNRHSAIGSHSWLAVSSSKKNLYATCWTDPPTIASYAINTASDIQLLNAAPTKSRSGYVCCSDTHVYSAGGATGEVFAIDRATGALTSGGLSTKTTPNGLANGHSNGKAQTISPVQDLDFVIGAPQRDDGSTMDFGGLRHGAHSADLSPDGSILYVADIGRNCIWTYSIPSASTLTSNGTGHTWSQQGIDLKDQHMALIEKHISPRSHDGPRHVWPHPNGRVVYVLQEHSSMVDVFSVDAQTHKLRHEQGVRIIPHGLPVNEFWADEVRTSFSHSSKNEDKPQYLYASTRGLKNGRKGFVAVYALDDEGYIKDAMRVQSQNQLSNGSSNPSKSNEVDDQDQGGLLCMYETATSGGWANAIQPGPTIDGVEYLALTDSEVGFVYILAWDGQRQTLSEAARVDLNSKSASTDATEKDLVVGAATAVWL